MTSMFGSKGPTGSLQSGSNTGSMKEKIPSGYKKGTINQFTPEQMELLQQMMGHAGPDSFLSKLAGGDQSNFAEMEAPALRQFSGLQGNLASRFSGMGGLGARKSSGFQNTMNSAASNFAQELQSNRQNLQRQALMDLSQLSNMLMGQRPQENFLVKKPQQTSWAETIGKLGGAIPGMATAAFGGGSMADAWKGASSIFGGGQSSLGSGYDQEFRMNPSAMGF